MTDLAQFPEAVRAKIEDLDRRIEGAKADLSQSMALRKAIIETAEACNPPRFVIAPNTNTRGAGSLMPPERKRQRRNIRDEVLAYFVARTGSPPASAYMCAATIDCHRKSVEQALMYHERAGRVCEVRDGVWSVVIEDDRSRMVEAESDA